MSLNDLDTGMPAEWQQILDDNGITRAEQEEHPDKVLAVVQYFQSQDKPDKQDEDIWQKMQNAGPAYGVRSPSPALLARDMSRENSQEGGARVEPNFDRFANPRAAPAPPQKAAVPRLQAERQAPGPPVRPQELTMPAPLATRTPSPQPHLDRSASQRAPATFPIKPKQLDRANTTRAPTTKQAPPPGGLQMTKSQSSQGRKEKEREKERERDVKAQEQGAPRRRDKRHEKEEAERVIRQLQSICTPGDPNQVYRSLHKIGQG